MKYAALWSGAAAVVVGLAAADVAAAPKFVGKPTAKVEGRGVTIAFTASEPTDVEVAVLNEKGGVVRHLAAGMLGKNAPAPLAKGSLAQSLLWDGTDDGGKRVAAGTYAVRLRLGTSAKFGRMVYWEEASLATRGVLGFDVDERGHIYGVNTSMWEGRGGGHQMLVWNREGHYLRQIIPIRRDVDLKRLPGVTFEELPSGQKDPSNVYWPGLANCRCVIVARDNRVTMFGRQKPDGTVHLVRVMAGDGGAPPEGWQGPLLPATVHKRFPGYMCFSPDGKTIYVAGLGAGGRVTNCVYRAQWSDEKAAVFVGKDAGLSDPRGLATDAKGRLYVCDFNHDRIVVFSPDGRELKALKVVGPEQIEIDRKTGAVYVYSCRDGIKRETGKSLMYQDKAIVKFAGFDNWKEVARIALPRRARHMHDAGPIMALDTSGEQPAILCSYVGRQETGDYLWKIVDRGAKLERVDAPIERYYWPFQRSYTAVAVDRERGVVYLGGRSFDKFYRLDTETGKLIDVAAITKDLYGTGWFEHPQVTGIALDSQGRIYVRLMGTWSSRQNWIRRYTRDGKRVPFEKAAKVEPEGRVLGRLKTAGEGDLIVTQPSRGYHSGGLAVAPNGDVYVIEKAVKEGGGFVKGNANALNVYGPDGAFKKCLIPWLSAGAWGPRLDREGNIYITDAIRPLDATSMNNGSLVKYGPDGGRVKMDVADGKYVTRRDERDLPKVALEGAEWVYYRTGLVPFGHCVCSAAQFDLDAYGRSVVPDVHRHRAIMVDSAGNFVTTFGEYGNCDSEGPMSSVPVPDIPLWEPNTIAVAGGATVVYDRRNHRILCTAFDYEDEATVQVTIK